MKTVMVKSRDHGRGLKGYGRGSRDHGRGLKGRGRGSKNHSEGSRNYDRGSKGDHSCELESCDDEESKGH
ncbi:1054_t:CDS:2, partial [Funneliformis mosseae]